MSTPTLGRLEKVDLRTAWTNESIHFTPWLANPENLKLLGEAVGIDLEFEAQEKDVGPFRADIFCKDTLDGSWVLNENQLERTDHTHLGQLLTYAAGLETVTIIWIAQRFAEERRATLDWLNEITNERFAFFGLEIELWRIGDSPIAPKINVISKPNEWTRTVQTSARKAEGISEHKQTQLEFWTAFKEYMEDKSHISCSKPAPQHWMDHSIGKGGFKLSSVASAWSSETSTWDPEIRVEFVTYDKDSKKYFSMLEADKAGIEREIGEPLKWHNPPNKRSCRIYLRPPANFLDHLQWPQQHDWLREHLEKLSAVFGPRVKHLDPSEAPSEISASPLSDSMDSFTPN